MSTLVTVAIIAAILGSALIGGIFFAFSNFVMKALERVPSSEGVSVMQSINVTVLNPWFLGAFMGTAIVSLVLVVVAITGWELARSPYLLAGAVAYIAGTWFVTVLGNVPLNDKLAAVKPDTAEASQVWAHYLNRWTKLNTLRTGAAAIATVLFSVVLVIH
ncbi:MAG: anthrone oxygenase family protein [Pseudomonadota bacterium]